jgi:hypothetical protein
MRFAVEEERYETCSTREMCCSWPAPGLEEAAYWKLFRTF